MPKVTVLMPVYNGEKYLREAIDSILSQTFTDFEFLIFNDGSTDNSADIIRSYSDQRIQFFDHKQNQGHVYHLNYGIEIAKGKYIVRMDADDISLPKRFEKQVAFMDKNPKIGVCGTWYEIIGSKDTVKHSTDDIDIRLDLLTHSALGHPTVILRTEILHEFKLYYDPLFVPAEDYLFWVNLSKYCELANFPEILLQYRIHQYQISNDRRQEQIVKTQLIRNHQIEILLARYLTNDEMNRHASLFQETVNLDNIDYFLNLKSWIGNLIHINSINQIYPKVKFSNTLIKKLNDNYINFYLKQINEYRAYNLKILKDFWISPNYHFSYFSNKQKLVFSIKCLLRYPIHL